MAIIKVTAEDLQSLSGQVSGGASNIQSELGSLANQVNNVVGSQWMGAASGQFSTLYNDWQNSATKLNTALDSISRLLLQASVQYQNTEDSVTSSMV
jgi:early secretory antigenic target protein ESAT-6